MKAQQTRNPLSILILGMLLCTGVLFDACANISVTSHSPETAVALKSIIDRGTLMVGTEGNMPPLNMTDKEGRLFGFEIDLAEDIAKGLGVALQWVTLPFSQLLPALEQGQVDMVLSGVTITMERNRSIAFVGPYFVSGKAFLTKIETISRAESTDRLNSPQMILTVMKDTTSAAFVSQVIPNAQVLETIDYGESVQLVLNDDAHAMVADYPVCAMAVFRNPGQGLLSVFTPFTYEPIGIGVRATDPHMINWLENFLHIYDGTGRLDELEARWFHDGAWLKRLP